jgi:hypothetical protein
MLGVTGDISPHAVNEFSASTSVLFSTKSLVRIQMARAVESADLMFQAAVNLDSKKSSFKDLVSHIHSTLVIAPSAPKVYYGYHETYLI